jgi:hypothetical protein
VAPTPIPAAVAAAPRAGPLLARPWSTADRLWLIGSGLILALLGVEVVYGVIQLITGNGAAVENVSGIVIFLLLMTPVLLSTRAHFRKRDNRGGASF